LVLAMNHFHMKRLKYYGVVPAQAGTHNTAVIGDAPWVPTCAGTTRKY